MSTAARRGSTWSNADGLVVGFGTNKPVLEGSKASNDFGEGGFKVASVTFSYADAGSANVPVPAGARVHDVSLVVEKAFAGGTALTVGDGADADGFITATPGALANLTAGAVIRSDGVYAFGTGATDHEVKVYSSADTIDVAVSGTFTAGVAALVVTYI